MAKLKRTVLEVVRTLTHSVQELIRGEDGFIIIFFGVRSLITKRSRSPLTVCPICKRPTSLVSSRERSFFHIFFIPLIPVSGARDYTQCPICKNMIGQHHGVKPITPITPPMESKKATRVQVSLKNGKVIFGEITFSDNENITVQTDNDVVAVPKEDIFRIDNAAALASPHTVFRLKLPIHREAKLALLFGIIGAVLVGIGAPLGIVAIVLAIRARRAIRTDSAVGGDGVAMAAIILGAISVSLLLFAILGHFVS